MDMLLMGWFILEFTGSPLMVAGVYGIRVVPMIFLGAVSGVIADRFDRRKMIIATRLGYMAVDLLLGTLISLKLIQYTHFIAIILLWGVCNTLNSTARSAYLTDIVGKADTLSAVSLEATVMSLTNIIGSPIFGLLIGWSASLCYFIAATIYAIQIIVYLTIRGVKQTYTANHESALQSLTDGLKYVGGVQTLSAVNFSAFIWNLLMAPFSITFMSVYARDVLNVGAAGLGLLSAAQAIGRMSASFILANLKEFKHKGLLVIVSTEAEAAFLILFSLTRFFPASLLLMAGVGATTALWGSATNALLLTVSTEEMRGRVMGVRMQAITGEPFGNLWTGNAAASMGIVPTLWIGTSIYLILTAALAAAAPKLRREP